MPTKENRKVPVGSSPLPLSKGAARYPHKGKNGKREALSRANGRSVPTDSTFAEFATHSTFFPCAVRSPYTKEAHHRTKDGKNGKCFPFAGKIRSLYPRETQCHTKRQHPHSAKFGPFRKGHTLPCGEKQKQSPLTKCPKNLVSGSFGPRSPDLDKGSKRTK